MYVAVSVGVWSSAAYGVQHHIVSLLLRPSHGQQFIQTTPGGGIDFLFRICLYTGFVFSIPVIVFQILKYIEPLVKKSSVKFVLYGSAASGLLAIAGMAFGYYLGLPAALHFLLNQFMTKQIETLISIQSYMSFVIMYMFGSALLFQIPLVILFINRIKPVKPRQLIKFERWFVLLSFILAALLDPSPHIMDQILLAGPMIMMYQVSIALIMYVNRPKHGKKVQRLFEKDLSRQAERLARRDSLKPLPLPPLTLKTEPALVPIHDDAVAPAATQHSSATTGFRPGRVLDLAPQHHTGHSPHPTVNRARPQKYLNDFVNLRPVQSIISNQEVA